MQTECSQRQALKVWSQTSDVVAFSETHADETVSDCCLADLEVYNVFRKDRNINGGGEAVLVSKRLNFIRTPEYEVDGVEFTWLKIVGIRMNLSFRVFYGPSCDITVFRSSYCLQTMETC